MKNVRQRWGVWRGNIYIPIYKNKGGICRKSMTCKNNCKYILGRWERVRVDLQVGISFLMLKSVFSREGKK